MNSIGGSHGGNAIRYAMDKDIEMYREKKVSIIGSNNLDCSDIAGYELDSAFVKDQMQLTQHKRKEIAKPFWRIEVCPPMEECQGWTEADWRNFVDEVVGELDRTDVLDKNGKVAAEHTDLAHSQWVAALHRDTDNWHVHIVANRVTEDGRVQDDYRSMTRAQLAANAIADRHGWTRAENRRPARKERIHADAVRVLRNMDRFDLDGYFARMRQLGYKVEARYDAGGVCRGYSIGEEIRHNGKLSSTIMLQASKLGHSRDLMVSQLEKTWWRLHPESARAQTGGMQHRDFGQNQPASPVIKPKEAFVTWRVGRQYYSVPERLDRLVMQEIRLPQPEEYANEVDGIPDIPSVEDAAGMAVSLLVGMMTADAHTGGGGGGGGSDLPWGRDKEKEENFARRAAAVASERCTPAHSAKVEQWRGRRR